MNLQNELRILEQIEEEDPLNAEQLANMTKWSCELIVILEEEELYWFKRAHEKWLHEDKPASGLG
jgi:hypothetical protein